MSEAGHNPEAERDALEAARTAELQKAGRVVLELLAAEKFPSPVPQLILDQQFLGPLRVSHSRDTVRQLVGHIHKLEQIATNTVPEWQSSALTKPFEKYDKEEIMEAREWLIALAKSADIEDTSLEAWYK